MAKSKCKEDCFNCPYDDCILDDSEISGNETVNVGEIHKVSGYDPNKYIKNREKILARNRAYYQSHKEQHKEYLRKWRKSHPYDAEKQHQYYLKARAKKLNEQNKDTN